MDDSALLTGPLYCWLRGVTTLQWQKRFYVLRRPSPQSKARIDYYDDSESFEKNPKNFKTILMEKVRGVKKTNIQGQAHTFELYVSENEGGKSQRFQFAADSRARLEEWMKALRAIGGASSASSPAPADTVNQDPRSHLDDHSRQGQNQDFHVPSQPSVDKMYRVTVLETEAAKRCHLAVGQEIDGYILPESLVLIQPDRRAVSWNYSHIRRYGCGREVFTFEAGRKSASGAGRFSLQIPYVDQFYRDLKEKMKGLQSDPGSTQAGQKGSPKPGRNAVPLPPLPVPNPLVEYSEPILVSRQSSSDSPTARSGDIGSASADIPGSNLRGSSPVYSVPVKVKQPQRSELAQLGDMTANDNPAQEGGMRISDLLDKIPSRTASPSGDLYDHIDLKRSFVDRPTERSSTSSDQCYGRLKPTSARR